MDGKDYLEFSKVENIEEFVAKNPWMIDIRNKYAIKK